MIHDHGDGECVDQKILLVLRCAEARVELRESKGDPHLLMHSQVAQAEVDASDLRIPSRNNTMRCGSQADW